jgi:hypothetical protein
MLIAFLLAAAPTEVALAIDRFCKDEPACIAAQRESLRYFLNLMVVSGTTDADAEGCMREGKRGVAIDWIVAEQCIRRVSKDRKAIAPFFEERG